MNPKSISKTVTKQKSNNGKESISEQKPISRKSLLGLAGDGECKIQIPSQITIENSLEEIFVFARQEQASDIHICAESAVIFRKFGSLVAQTQEKLTAQRTQELIEGAFDKDTLSEFLEHGDFEFVYTIEGAGRFRITLMKQRNCFELTARIIPKEIRSFEEIGMPESCKGLTKFAQGLVLITGPAGCGKSSSLATLVNMINKNRQEHIITIENPIEIIYKPDQCQITQREINTHTQSYANALRAALREDPDILVVSELRDLESIRLAITAAETGHLVFGTMNTNYASQTILTLLDSFPSDEQSVITNMLSESLRGIISQQLIPKQDGSGIVPVFEVLIVNAAIANLIRNGQTISIENQIAMGKSQGMVLFDNALRDLVSQNIISKEEALLRAINPSNLA